MNEPRIDYDPRPSHSPRLYGSADDVAGARPRRESFMASLSPAKLRRLRHMAIIRACRECSPPVPFSTLVCELGISDSQARLLYKKSCRMHLRRSRV